jgi:hypothetical protein
MDGWGVGVELGGTLGVAVGAGVGGCVTTMEKGGEVTVIPFARSVSLTAKLSPTLDDTVQDTLFAVISDPRVRTSLPACRR